MTANNQLVTNDIIYNYFGKFKPCIKHIIIDDDNNIKLNGNLTGNINNGLMPIIGWKNYWYGKYRIIDYIHNLHTYDDEMIVNMRFDILNNHNSFKKDPLITFIKTNTDITHKKNVFMFDHEKLGIDNMYIGNIKTMHKLISTFHHDLDNILNEHNDTIHQEMLVYRVNSYLFE